MSNSIDRLGNLIRVLHGVDLDDFDMKNWCRCACGHAGRDQYFIDEVFEPGSIARAAEFFGITLHQSYELFTASSYILDTGKLPTPADVIAKLQVLLMEKRAQEPAALDRRAGGFAVENRAELYIAGELIEGAITAFKSPELEQSEEWDGLTKARELEPVS